MALFVTALGVHSDAVGDPQNLQFYVTEALRRRDAEGFLRTLAAKVNDPRRVMSIGEKLRLLGEEFPAHHRACPEDDLRPTAEVIPLWQRTAA